MEDITPLLNQDRWDPGGEGVLTKGGGGSGDDPDDQAPLQANVDGVLGVIVVMVDRLVGTIDFHLFNNLLSFFFPPLRD